MSSEKRAIRKVIGVIAAGIPVPFGCRVVVAIGGYLAAGGARFYAVSIARFPKLDKDSEATSQATEIPGLSCISAAIRRGIEEACHTNAARFADM